MITIDTNIVVRFLTQDDAAQYQKSLQLFESQAIFIPNTVILESEWVLRFSYQYQTHEIHEAFRRLFGLPNVHVANTILIAQALQWYENGLDFADALHLSQSQHCTEFYTFDEKFVKKAKQFTNAKVKKP